MFTRQTAHSHVSGAPISTKRIWWRLLILFVLLLLSVAIYVILIRVAPPSGGPVLPFLPVWFLCLLPYFAACTFVLATKPLRERWFWVELSMILLGAFVFRIMLLPLSPGLSRDVWRYLWDARVIVHGYSPYVYAPGDKVLEPLRNILFTNSRFRNIPTDYPPGAEIIYVLGYLLAQQNPFGLKGLFVLFDIGTCVALSRFLIQKKLDPRRVIIYAWCPLPIVEFAIEGHVDAITVTFIVLSILCATSARRSGRVLTGFLIGMATLTRLYPILLLAVVLRRRDWALLLTCFITIFLGYLPFLILGHGQVLGFFVAYFSEQGGNAGIVQQEVHGISSWLGLNLAATTYLEYIVDLIFVSTITLGMLVLRQRKRISMQAATLLLICTAFAIASHIYPWYVVTLLPWVAVLQGPWLTEKTFRNRRLAIVTVKRLIIAWAWYFVCTALLDYTPNMRDLSTPPNWFVAYTVTYGRVTGKLVVAATIGIVLLAASFLLKHSSSITREGRLKEQT